MTERLDNRHIDLKSARFAEVEKIRHEIGQRLARQLGHELTDRQSGKLYSDDDDCPACVLECEAIRESEDFGWGLCAEWNRACWQGRVDDVAAELSEWLERHMSITRLHFHVLHS